MKSVYRQCTPNAHIRTAPRLATPLFLFLFLFQFVFQFLFFSIQAIGTVSLMLTLTLVKCRSGRPKRAADSNKFLFGAEIFTQQPTRSISRNRQ